MRMLVTGLSGLNKKAPLERIAEALKSEGLDLDLCHLGSNVRSCLLDLLRRILLVLISVGGV